jgi:hypothetical protein
MHLEIVAGGRQHSVANLSEQFAVVKMKRANSLLTHTEPARLAIRTKKSAAIDPIQTPGQTPGQTLEC